METTAPAPQTPFMLLFRNAGPEVFAALSAEQRQELILQWNSWFDALLSQGKATEGQPLEDQTRIVRGPGGARVVDGPYPEAKEAVAGYVKLRVSGWDEATQIAQRHPALAYGFFIEVRELTPQCHLGVTTRPAEVAAAV